MTIEMTDVVVRNAALMAAPIDNELVILGLISNNYIALDEIGRHIWDLLETERPVDDLCHRLEREYAAAPEQIASDVLPFLTELRDEGIVHVIGKRSA
jgi:hypothetical protein